MEKKNKLDQVNLANISENEVNKIKELEKQLGGKYVLIAFEKES